MKSFPLIVDGEDESLDRDEAVIGAFPVMWDSQYHSDFRDTVRNSIERGKEQIKKKSKSIRRAGFDVVLTLERIKADNVHLRGDKRYSSEEMAKFLCSSDHDLVPPIIGRTSAGAHLLDGHHRWRAYLEAGIDPLVLSIQLEPQSGDVPQIIVDVKSENLQKGMCQKHEGLLRTFIRECLRN